MATKAKKPATKSKRKTPAATGENGRATKQMWAVVLFASGLLLGALTFIKGDKLWLSLHNILFGLFGWSVFFFAPLVVYIAVIAAMDRPLSTIRNKLWQVVALIIIISGAIQVFGGGLPETGGFFSDIKSLYGQGVELTGGGVAAGIFGVPLLLLFDKTGAGIIIVLAIFVFAMLVTGSTLIGLFRSAAKPVKNIGDAYAEAAESREQRRLERESRPVPAAVPKATAASKSNRFDIDVDISADKSSDAPWYSEDTAPVAPIIEDKPPIAEDIPLPEAQTKAEALPTHPVVSEKPPQKERLIDILESTVEYIPTEEFVKTPDPADEPEPAPPEDDTLRRHALGDDILRAEQQAANELDELDEVIQSFLGGSVEPHTSAEPAAPVHVEYEEIPTPNLADFEILEPHLDKSKPWEEEEIEQDMPKIMVVPAFGGADGMPHVYQHPPVNLLKLPTAASSGDVTEELKQNAQVLVDTLKSFGVQTRITDICRGPAVTRYELQPSAGVKISKITGLSDDIALNLASAGIRIEAPIPNKAAVGIEVPNKTVSVVSIRELIDSQEFKNAESSLSVALGRDIAGNITIADLGRMPHVLIAGSTGSGKSVCINSIIISLLYKSSPDEVKLLMVDPKVVELGVYNGIPHLLVPVVTDPKKAAGALNWAVVEMLRRYKEFADHSVRDLAGYNRLAESREDLKPMPKIVIIIDELADLMMAAPNDVEDAICRLAQMARAAGMHLVIATQRPSVDVITGVIKANIPSRVAFAVSSQVDSRTILDMGGAEKLLGRGDMLFYPVGAAKPQRVQGCFVTDTEVESVVEFVKAGASSDSYDQQIVEEIDRQVVAEKGSSREDNSGGFDDEDEMLPQAIECVVEAGMASTSQLQRRLKLGYARAARIIDQLEERGIVGPFEGSKPRQVLISKDRWLEMKLSGNSES